MREPNPNKHKHPFDFIAQNPEALADEAVGATAQQIHRHRSQERDHSETLAIAVALNQGTEMGIAHTVPFGPNAPALTDQTQEGLRSGTQAGDGSVAED